MQKHQKLFTGFNFLDQKWGGIYQGGNYLVFGPRKSGKTVLILNIIEYLTESKNNVLFLTSERKKNIEIQSSSIYFDISEKIADGNLRVLKLTRDLNILESIKTEIENIRPSFLVVDEVINANFSAIGKSYTDLLEHLENQNITSFFVSSLPMDENSRKFLKDIVRNSTGIIHLQKSVENRNYSGILKLKPNIGHFEGEFETSYKIEPIKGMITLSDNENTIMEILS